MRLVTVSILAATLLTLVSGLAAADDANPYTIHAAFVSDVIPEASCDGWSSDVIVRFRWAQTSMSATFTVTLADASGDVLETVSWVDQLVREDGTWPTQVFHYDGIWTAFGPDGDYVVDMTVSIEAPYTDGVDHSELTATSPFHCAAVATEELTLTELRGMYR